MMVEDARPETLLINEFPRSPQPIRSQFGRADGVPLLLSRLAEQHFDGTVTARSNPHTLSLLLLDGNAVCARLTSGPATVLEGADALRGWCERAAPDAGTRSMLNPIERPVVESLTATLDPYPESTPLASVGQLREALRHLASVGHHGVVDVVTGVGWGRVLFHRGQVLGAYHRDDLALAASLAAMGPLANADDSTMTVRAAQVVHPLRWPAPRAIVEPVRAEPTAQPVDLAHDERIESDLLWLLSDVDRDRERAAHSSAADVQLVQVLASFVNSAVGLAGPSTTMGLPAAIRDVQRTHPQMVELPLKGERIDPPVLARRYRGLPADGRTDVFADTCRALLVLARQSVQAAAAQLTSQAAALRCATALEACIISVELELPSRRLRGHD